MEQEVLMAVGNPWFSAVEQTLPQYVPLPFNELMAAGQQLQQRYDTNLAGLEETATGLASIEARLPGHQRYVTDYANRYRQEADELLGRFNNNAADPQFTRELSRLRSKYSNDPNLRTIMMANEAAKRNEELSARMAAEGKLFINPQATGVDSEGRIINDVGQVRGVNTLDNFRERLKIAAGSRTEYGNLIGNRPALEQAQKEILNSINSGSPEMQDLQQAYISRGLSPERAANQMTQDIIRMSGEYAIEEGTNWQKMNFNAAERDRALRRAAERAKQEGRMNVLIPIRDSIEVRNLNENLLKNVEQIEKRLDSSGKLSTSGGEVIPATPENMKKYPNAKYFPTAGRGPGTLQIPSQGGPSQEDIDYLSTIKEEMGDLTKGTIDNPKQLLADYKEYLKLDNNAPTYWVAPTKEERENITTLYFNNLSDAIIVNKEGDVERVADGDVNIDFDDLMWTGNTTSQVNKRGFNLNGAMKAVAKNKDGELVSIYKPLPVELQNNMNNSLLIDRVYSTPNVTNEKLKTDPSFRGLLIPTQDPNTGEIYLDRSNNIIPQLKGGKVLFYEVDNDNNIVGEEFDPAEINALVEREQQIMSSYFNVHTNTIPK